MFGVDEGERLELLADRTVSQAATSITIGQSRTGVKNGWQEVAGVAKRGARGPRCTTVADSPAFQEVRVDLPHLIAVRHRTCRILAPSRVYQHSGSSHLETLLLRRRRDRDRDRCTSCTLMFGRRRTLSARLVVRPGRVYTQVSAIDACARACTRFCTRACTRPWTRTCTRVYTRIRTRVCTRVPNCVCQP